MNTTKERVLTDTVKDALKNMPLHWDNERQRVDYFITHAEEFKVCYHTHKTHLESDIFSDLETARKAAKFASEVSRLRGGKLPRGIEVRAVLGNKEAFVEAYGTPDSNGSNGKAE